MALRLFDAKILGVPERRVLGLQLLIQGLDEARRWEARCGLARHHSFVAKLATRWFTLLSGGDIHPKAHHRKIRIIRFLVLGLNAHEDILLTKIAVQVWYGGEKFSAKNRKIVAFGWKDVFDEVNARLLEEDGLKFIWCSKTFRGLLYVRVPQ